jgi:hypothetical protein
MFNWPSRLLAPKLRQRVRAITTKGVWRLNRILLNILSLETEWLAVIMDPKIVVIYEHYGRFNIVLFSIYLPRGYRPSPPDHANHDPRYSTEGEIVIKEINYTRGR